MRVDSQYFVWRLPLRTPADINRLETAMHDAGLTDVHIPGRDTDGERTMIAFGTRDGIRVNCHLIQE